MGFYPYLLQEYSSGGISASLLLIAGTLIDLLILCFLVNKQKLVKLDHIIKQIYFIIMIMKLLTFFGAMASTRTSTRARWSKFVWNLEQTHEDTEFHIIWNEDCKLWAICNERVLVMWNREISALLQSFIIFLSSQGKKKKKHIRVYKRKNLFH